MEKPNGHVWLPFTILLLIVLGILDLVYSCWPQTSTMPVGKVLLFEIQAGQDIKGEIQIGTPQEPQLIVFPLVIDNLHGAVEANATIFLQNDLENPIDSIKLAPGVNLVKSASPRLIAASRQGFANILILYSGTKATSIDHGVKNVTQDLLVGAIRGAFGKKAEEFEIGSYYWKEISGEGYAVQTVPAKLLFGETDAFYRVGNDPPTIRLLVTGMSKVVGVGCRIGPDQTRFENEFEYPPLPGVSLAFQPPREIVVGRPKLSVPAAQYHPVCVITDSLGRRKTVSALYTNIGGTLFLVGQYGDGFDFLRLTVEPPEIPQPKVIKVYGKPVAP